MQTDSGARLQAEQNPSLLILTSPLTAEEGEQTADCKALLSSYCFSQPHRSVNPKYKHFNLNNLRRSIS